MTPPGWPARIQSIITLTRDVTLDATRRTEDPWPPERRAVVTPYRSLPLAFIRSSNRRSAGRAI